MRSDQGRGRSTRYRILSPQPPQLLSLSLLFSYHIIFLTLTFI